MMKSLIQISRHEIDKQTVQSKYEINNIHFTINSHFCGSIELSEVIYQMIIKSEQNKPLFIG